MSVRNHYEKSGLCHASDIYGDGGVPGAGRYLDGVIVAVTSSRWKTVRVGYPAKYFGGMPRYATIPMQNLRSPNVAAADLRPAASLLDDEPSGQAACSPARCAAETSGVSRSHVLSERAARAENARLDRPEGAKDTP